MASDTEEYDESGLDPIRGAFDELEDGSLYDLPKGVRVAFSKTPDVSAETEGYYVDPGRVDLPKTTSYDRRDRLTKECGSKMLTVTYTGKEFSTIYTLTCTYTCDYVIDGTPGCCEKWLPESRLRGEGDKVDKTVEASLEGCLVCDEGWARGAVSYSTVADALESFTMLCDECCRCDCGGIFRLSRGMCRKTKVIGLLALRLPETFGRLPPDLIRYLGKLL